VPGRARRRGGRAHAHHPGQERERRGPRQTGLL
jgi:hypothetical protein